MRKQLLPLLLALSLLPAPALGAEGTTFVDVSPGDWFAPYVETCVKEGLLNGVGEEKFNPQGVLNGDEALAMAARVLLAANGEPEFPKGPDAQDFWEEFGWEEGQRYSFGLSVAETQSYVDAWYWDALYYLAKAAGPELFSEGIVYSCSRQTFFQALAFASQGVELEEINDVFSVPGTRNEDILRLYRAGILSGSDGYGSFSGGRGLTRAEAAAALARIVKPELRMRFSLQPPPYQGYTLIPLIKTGNRYHLGLTYPVAAVTSADDADRRTILVTEKGDLADFPEGGKIFSSGIGRSYDYAQFYVVDDKNWTAKTWLMDKDGNYAPGSGEHLSLSATGDGHFLASDTWSDGETGHTSWYLLSPGGTVEAELPETLGSSSNSWYGFNEGLCPWMDEETKLWGYVDAQGQWAISPVWTGAESFSGGYCVVYNDKGQHIVMDRTWTPVQPIRIAEKEYTDFCLPCSSPGYEGPKGLIYWEDWQMNQGLMTLDGSAVYLLPDSVSSPVLYYNGYASVYDEAEGGYYYLDSRGQRVSETFDWCGDVSPDGRGLVGADGMVYRIQFEP